MCNIGRNLSVLLFLIFASVRAESLPFSLEFEVDGVSYVESVPRPQGVLGHEIGTRHSSPDQIVAYFTEVGVKSDRVQLRKHGFTYEGRPLIHAVVTSAENQSRLEDLRQENLLFSEKPGQTADDKIRSMPAVVMMGYSVHGNEASGSEAAMLLLYHLAAGRGTPIDSILQNLIIIIDPMLNPDGRNRFVNWVNENRGRVATSDPDDREHNEPWPGGRTNHYWFDLNRDWLPAQLKETKGRLQLFHHWRPQVMADFHEMGSDSTYFFQPGIPTRTNPLTPEVTSNLTAQIASYHARALDGIRSLYYSEETFDDFYYGKGSTYPDLNGAVGILFEQASSRALQRRTQTGILRYDFTIRNQLATSISTLVAAAELREKLLRHQRDFYLESDGLANRNRVKAYIINKRQEGRRGLFLIETLLQHRIRVYDLRQSQEIDGVRFDTGEAVIVPTAQPQTRLLQTLMEKVTEFQDTSFYDVSTWTFPLAMGVTVCEVQQNLSDVLGDEVDEALAPPGKLAGGQSDFAYLMEWSDFMAPKSLYRLQSAGIATRFLVEPIEIEVNDQPRVFDRATIVIPVGQDAPQAQHVHETVSQLVQRDGATVFAVQTGLTHGGPDLGGPSSRVLEEPSVALLSGPGTNRYQVGETWFLLSERMEIPVSLVSVEILNKLNLSRYNTLVMTGGSYEGLSEKSVDQLRTWIQSGGLLLAVQGAVRWAIEQKLIDETLKDLEKESPQVPYSEVQKSESAQRISGAIFQVVFDRTHPVAFGQQSRGAVFRTHEFVVEPSESPGANVALYSDAPLLSGYVSTENLKQLKGSASIIARKVGSGAVVLFVDNPNFRAFWHGTSTAFLNALFFGRSL